MSSEWKTVVAYIQALPEGIQLKNGNQDVEIKADSSITVSVEELHKVIVDTIKTEPSYDAVKFFNAFLKENAAGLSKDLISDLPNYLSLKMSGLNLIVEIPSSLTDTLLKAKNGNYSYPGQDNDKHKVSVILQIPEPDQTTHTAVGSDVIKQIPNLKYNHTNQFSIDFKLVELKETIFTGDVTDIQALVALVVALKLQPTSWRGFIWDAWLAVAIQLCLLENDKEIFPCQWMKQVFYAETLVSPDKVRCFMLGQDPVSIPNETIGLAALRNATGVAFHGIGNDNSSIEGMYQHYGINCYDDGPIDLCKDGKLLVNMIRCIGFKDWSVSNNSCRGAWAAYTLKLAHHFTKQNKPVIVFCKFPAALPAMYMPAACVAPNLTIVPHPAYVKPDRDEDDIAKVKEILAKL